MVASADLSFPLLYMNTDETRRRRTNGTESILGLCQTGLTNMHVYYEVKTILHAMTDR
jgi:hypothetical protein